MTNKEQQSIFEMLHVMNRNLKIRLRKKNECFYGMRSNFKRIKLIDKLKGE